MFGNTGVAGGYQSVGFGATSDGVYLPGAGGTGGIILTSAWGIRGAFNHNWDPYWSTSLWGSYAQVKYDGNANDNLTAVGTTSAKGAYCAMFAATHAGQTCCWYLQLQPRLQHRSGWFDHPLDSRQELDVLG